MILKINKNRSLILILNLNRPETPCYNLSSITIDIVTIVGKNGQGQYHESNCIQKNCVYKFRKTSGIAKEGRSSPRFTTLRCVSFGKITDFSKTV